MKQFSIPLETMQSTMMRTTPLQSRTSSTTNCFKASRACPISRKHVIVAAQVGFECFEVRAFLYNVVLVFVFDGPNLTYLVHEVVTCWVAGRGESPCTSKSSQRSSCGSCRSSTCSDRYLIASQLRSCRGGPSGSDHSYVAAQSVVCNDRTSLECKRCFYRCCNGR